MSELTPRDREVIQDHIARRYLQLKHKRIGRRRTDLPMPASAQSPSQQEREIVQDLLARQMLARRFPIVGRRKTDRRPADFRGNLERYIAWQISQEPWRRRRG